MTAPAAGTVHAGIKASGWHVDAVGICPIQNNFSLFARLGALFNAVKTSVSSTGAVVFAPGTNTSPKHSGSDWKLGIGAGHDFTPTVGARVEWGARQQTDFELGPGTNGANRSGCLAR